MASVQMASFSCNDCENDFDESCRMPVQLDCGHVKGRVEAVVLDNQVHDVIIGNHVTFENGVRVKIPVFPTLGAVSLQAVQARGQTRKQEEKIPTNERPLGANVGAVVEGAPWKSSLTGVTRVVQRPSAEGEVGG